ncbi:MAG: hypothetical protein FWF49_00990 [Oscillospiraceae bacterium]|nr:hypothetical protein [Oscillospiraceae bacterium]
MNISINKYTKTAALSAREQTNGGIVYLLPDILLRAFTLIPLTYLWRVVMASDAQVGMTLPQMLTYTYVSALLADMLVVHTPATGWLSEGVLQQLYGRPLPVIGQLAALSVGRWLPGLVLFSLPMALLSPLVGISLLPASPLFLISLPLCVSLGFAVDILFACLSIKLRNMQWMIGRIRAAIVALFSGTIIPIRLLPFGRAAHAVSALRQPGRRAAVRFCRFGGCGNHHPVTAFLEPHSLADGAARMEKITGGNGELWRIKSRCGGSSNFLPSRQKWIWRGCCGTRSMR